ncbi:leucine-rich repeat-like protein [Zymoseptoria brevis]|uniref:Leucine-rich repeat-like protein n=1 Tax=Zymoseptoria brevis TaxID=1047168 RepID=A0A0F4GIU0_9PEZI|nr:leucine-rich repeat-like protein [Zymoseptoria brevis]
MYFTVNTFLSLALASIATAIDYSHIDRDGVILIDLKHDVTSDPTSALASWSEKAYLCTYEHTTCTYDEANERPLLIGLDLSHLHLSGPSDRPLEILFLEFLGDLTSFTANENSFTGQLSRNPLSSNLSTIDISFNQLNGSIPDPALWKINSLQRLDLGSNDLSGNLPDTFFAQKDLQVLFVPNNKLGGAIPEFADTALRAVSLASCSFTGAIPKSIGKAKNLEEVYFYGNAGLKGKVPEELCRLPKLIVADLTNTGVNKSNLGPACRKAQKAGVLKL